MPTPPRSFRTQIAYIWATFFGAGYFPKAPGTAGTAAALPLAYLVSQVSTPWQIFTAALVTILGIVASQEVCNSSGVADNQIIVIDEVAGILITLIGVPFTVPNVIAGFVLFRLFDMTKPWPASYFDRKVKNGAGVVLDDVFAGFYGRAVMALLAALLPATFAH